MSWLKITCEQREQLVDRLGRSYNGLAAPEFCVLSGRTDLDGQFGDPSIETTWGRRETEQPVLRDIRYPPRYTGSDSTPKPDARPCEHFEFQDDGW